jgi:hypothetical protein
MLLIEKVIKLLDDFHHEALRNHVKNISKRSYFPLVLIEAINRDITKSQSIEDLCFNVYGEFNEKIRKKFLQLAHYTFKLTAFLSKNYPDFLHSNISKVQSYINHGELSKANFLADTLYEVSRKIEDFSTELRILQIQAQQNFLMESGYFALKQQERIKELLVYQMDLNDVNSYIFEHFDPKNKIDRNQLKKHLNFFSKYTDHASIVVQLICRYYKIFANYQFKNEAFYSSSTFLELLNLEKEFQKNDYLIFPYLCDYQYSINYLILECKYRSSSGNEILKETDRLTKQSEDTLFWNSFINLPELNSIELQSNHYYRLFLSELISDSENLIPTEYKEAITKLKERCKLKLENEIMEQMFILQYINLSRIHAQMLVFGGEDEKEQLVENLESILYMYQQVPFHTQVVGIYNVLIVTNYLLKKYSKVDELVRRFKRVTKDKLVNQEDLLIINGFFYASKWMETKRPQYLQKLNLVRSQALKDNLNGVIKTLDALVLNNQVIAN